MFSSRRRLSGTPQHAHVQRVPQCQRRRDDVTISNTGAGNLVVRADRAVSASAPSCSRGHSDSRIDWSGSSGKVSFYYNPGTTRPRPISPTANGVTAVPYRRCPTSSPPTCWSTTSPTCRTSAPISPAPTRSARTSTRSRLPAFAPLGNFTSPQWSLSTGQPHHQQPDDRARSPASVSPARRRHCSARLPRSAWCAIYPCDNSTVTARTRTFTCPDQCGVPSRIDGGSVEQRDGHATHERSHGSRERRLVAGGSDRPDGMFGSGASGATHQRRRAPRRRTSPSAISVRHEHRQPRGRTQRGNPRHDTPSTASGNVTGGTNTYVGGLVGRNENGSAIVICRRERQRPPCANATGSGRRNWSVSISAASTWLPIAGGAVTGGASARDHSSRPGSWADLSGCSDAAGTINTFFADRQCECRREQLGGRPGRLQQRHDHWIRRRRNGLLFRQYRRRARRVQRQRSDDHRFLRDRRCERRRK